jgi:hypothetical protein
MLDSYVAELKHGIRWHGAINDYNIRAVRGTPSSTCINCSRRLRVIRSCYLPKLMMVYSVSPFQLQ